LFHSNIVPIHIIFGVAAYNASPETRVYKTLAVTLPVTIDHWRAERKQNILWDWSDFTSNFFTVHSCDGE
jgi:hypothetical protein